MEKGVVGFKGIVGLFFIISLPLLIYQNSTYTSVLGLLKITQSTDYKGTKAHTNGSSINNSNKLLDGLLPLGFDSKSCLSRYESHLYRKSSAHKPSRALLSKLRNYERLHRRCGPNTWQYKMTIGNLNANTTQHILNTTYGCNYIVALPINGLGNRMISLASTFLYAILTNRVLLVELESEMSGVFCEPFLNSTWELPWDFPDRHRLYYNHLPTYGSLVKDVIGAENATELAESILAPPILNVHLHYDNPLPDRFFHCREGQRILKRVPFLILKSDQYFAPSLFLIPEFKKSLNEMFPKKDNIFHHLGRYLFSPSNQVWSQITRFYNDNLSKADTKVGIQVRVFSAKDTPSKMVMDQILSCTLNNHILPKFGEARDITIKNDTSMSLAILVTSLYQEYSENLRALYVNEEAIRVYQPSHEGVQRYHNNTHHLQALVEIYLLSLCDKLVTSGQSTFGYVAQGLGGHKPWIMYRAKGAEVLDPPCVRLTSSEPCYQFPPTYDCMRRVKVNRLSSVSPNVMRCEDMSIGLKLVNEA